MGWLSRSRRAASTALRIGRRGVRAGIKTVERARELRETGKLVVGAKVGYSRIGPVLRLAVGVGTPEDDDDNADVTTVALVLPIPRELHDSLQDALPEEGLQLARPLVRKPAEAD